MYCAILDVEVWSCRKLGRFGRYWRCISGWFGGECFRGLQGIGKLMDDPGVLEVKTHDLLEGLEGSAGLGGMSDVCEELEVFVPPTAVPEGVLLI